MPKARTARAPRRQSVTRSAVEGNEKPFMALCQGRPPLSVYPGKEPDCTIGLADPVRATPCHAKAPFDCVQWPVMSAIGRSRPASMEMELVGHPRQ
jgi:hypothetical protein